MWGCVSWKKYKVVIVLKLICLEIVAEDEGVNDISMERSIERRKDKDRILRN